MILLSAESDLVRRAITSDRCRLSLLRCRSVSIRGVGRGAAAAALIKRAIFDEVWEVCVLFRRSVYRRDGGTPWSWPDCECSTFNHVRFTSRRSCYRQQSRERRKRLTVGSDWLLVTDGREERSQSWNSCVALPPVESVTQKHATCCLRGWLAQRSATSFSSNSSSLSISHPHHCRSSALSHA